MKTSSTNMRHVATAMRQGNIIIRETKETNAANEGVDVLNQRLTELNDELKAETDKVQADLSPDKLPLTEVVVQPKKSEINVSGVTLAWLPYLATADGKSQPAY